MYFSPKLLLSMPAARHAEHNFVDERDDLLASGQDRDGITRAAEGRKRTSCRPTDLRAGPTPIPRQQFVEFLDGMFGDAGQDVGEPGLRIDVVDLGGDDQAVHGGGALAAAIGAAEQPGLSAQGDAAQRALGGIVGQADAAIIEEAGERGPALEHVVHGLGDLVAARELGALLAHPASEIGDQRRAELLAHGQALCSALGR